MPVTGRHSQRKAFAALIAVGAFTIALAGWNVVSAVTRAGDRTAVIDNMIRVIDGDTIVIGAEHIRIENLDAPEMPGRAKCPHEAELALKAKAEMQRLVDSGPVTLKRMTKRPKDRYGRTLADVLVGGRDVAPGMIAAGVARPWRGKSSNWCG